MLTKRRWNKCGASFSRTLPVVGQAASVGSHLQPQQLLLSMVKPLNLHFDFVGRLLYSMPGVFCQCYVLMQFSSVFVIFDIFLLSVIFQSVFAEVLLCV